MALRLYFACDASLNATLPYTLCCFHLCCFFKSNSPAGSPLGLNTANDASTDENSGHSGPGRVPETPVASHTQQGDDGEGMRDLTIGKTSGSTMGSWTSVNGSQRPSITVGRRPSGGLPDQLIAHDEPRTEEGAASFQGGQVHWGAEQFQYVEHDGCKDGFDGLESACQSVPPVPSLMVSAWDVRGKYANSLTGKHDTLFYDDPVVLEPNDCLYPSKHCNEQMPLMASGSMPLLQVSRVGVPKWMNSKNILSVGAMQRKNSVPSNYVAVHHQEKRANEQWQQNQIGRPSFHMDAKQQGVQGSWHPSTSTMQHQQADIVFKEKCLESSDLSGDSFTADVTWLSNAEKAGFQRQWRAAEMSTSARSYLYTASFKLFGLTAADLPPNMQDHLFSMMQVVPDMVDGTIRPGCVELAVDFWMGSEKDLHTAYQHFRQAFVSSNEALPLWLKNADVTLPDCDISVRDGRSVLCADGRSDALEILMVDAHVTGMDETQLVLTGTHDAAHLHALCRLEGFFYPLEVMDVAYDSSKNTIVTVSLPVEGTGLAWVEVTVEQGAGKKPLKSAVPIALTDMAELASEVSPHLARLWKDRRRAELACFLRDVYMLEHRAVAGATFEGSCGRIMAQAARFGWEETLMEASYCAEDGGCLKEVLTGGIPGGQPLLAHAVMCGRADSAELVLELLNTAGLLDDVRQWKAPGMASALEWASLYPDKKLARLLSAGCPALVVSQLELPSRSTPASRSVVEDCDDSGPTTSLASADRDSPPGGALPGGTEGETQLMGTGLALRLSSWPVALLSVLLLLLVVGVLWEGRNDGVCAEWTALCVLLWLSLFVLFPLAHKHILSKSFQAVQGSAFQAGLAVTSAMAFEDPQVQSAYAVWAVSDMGRMWWTGIELLYIWAPLIVFGRKTMRHPVYLGGIAVLAAVYGHFALKRRRSVGRGDLEAAQWYNFGFGVVNYLVLATIDWLVGDLPAPFSFQGPMLLLFHFIASRSVHAALQAPSDMGPMRWLPLTRLTTSAAFYLTVCIHFGNGAAELGARASVPVW
eukprot:CAMPEP_0177776668 /NCGR_PEP_ID=MMETSP0491_2-20121128/14842_1 /TAXON_ID=63592 /ORGANISM="Tetraselmis chuii, Strain PLY429" /LENGTH=1038 /DNA_ID=CAMNT_0019295487 /DNA_START=516 /DNA_END=3629 /DNA_ORIENTATION=+